MKIERLTLTHVRAFSQAEFEFQPGLNLLVGINGAGKSTILDVLRILFSYSLPQFTVSQARPIPFAETDITVGQGAMTVELEFTASDTPFEHLVHIPRDEQGKPKDKKSTLNNIAHHVGRRRRIQLRREEQEGYRVVSLNELSRDENVNLKELKSNIEQPLLVYFSTRRSIPNMSSAKNRPGGQADAYVEALDDRRGLQVKKHAEQWLVQQELAKEDNTRTRRLEILSTAVKQFLDNCINLRAVREPETTLLIDKGDKALDIRMLSDGERSMVALVLDLASRLAIANPHLEDPLTDGKAIVLIDELDLHLHPRWQRTIARQLTETFPNCQFIVTTYSPFIIQSLKPGELINLDPNSDDEDYADKSIEDIAEDVMGITMPQKSERYLQMMDVAEKYYRTLAKAKNSEAKELAQLKQKLDELSVPFSDDPAFTAFLKFQRENALRENETNQ